jgi:hypothetical protein
MLGFVCAGKLVVAAAAASASAAPPSKRPRFDSGAESRSEDMLDRTLPFSRYDVGVSCVLSHIRSTCRQQQISLADESRRYASECQSLPYGVTLDILEFVEMYIFPSKSISVAAHLERYRARSLANFAEILRRLPT